MDEQSKNQVNAFAQAIVECTEYRTFMECNEELDKNLEARELLERYQQNQRDLQWSGYDATLLDELKDLQRRVKSDETLTNFFNSQAALVDLLKRTNDRISEKIGQPFAQKRQGGCC